jgi:hypothetical protein
VKTHGYDITQARLHRKTLCYSRVRGNAVTLDPIVATLPQVLGCADSSMIHGIIQQRLINLPKRQPMGFRAGCVFVAGAAARSANDSAVGVSKGFCSCGDISLKDSSRRHADL